MNQVVTKADIPGYGGLYYATTDGEVFNARTGRKLTVQRRALKKSDAYVVSLSGNSGDRKTKERSMSWIMRMCFFGGRPGALKHKDGVKSNWALQNLKLCSLQEVSKMHDMPNRTPICYRKNDGTEIIYPSVRAAAEALGVARGTVTSWVSGNTRCTLLDGVVFREEEPEKIDNRPPYSVKKVVWERPDGTRKEWASSTLAAKELFCSAGAVRSWCSGRYESSFYEGRFFYEEYQKRK